MNMRKIWKVPLFCIIAGVITFKVAVFLFSGFTIVTLPDGTITTNNTRQLIIYGAIFIVTLILGGMLFRNMTKKEIFFSASIMVVISLITNLTQWAFNITSGPALSYYIYLGMIFEWSSAVTLLLCQVIENLWVVSIISSFTPYLFIPFGIKEQV
ncbi:hypothetical protein [Anaerotignum sp. MB30-C6]|uniref:hypothetical protein n=1 Tax=Anaerotignum sp. MB30-C6 TaxID=3070814 RepID=UPI0027DDA8A5|nr:hypothetical protein [Anaerotignum sp. MB30-C6]WMI80568.1 hypothetical protein RBQ60_12125 [Anaerotignum sp. MB30-C6]